MPAKHFHFRMPEGGAERELFWVEHHRCPEAEWLSKELEDDDIDILIFPVGFYFEGHPANTTLVVETSDVCRACGKGPFAAWFTLDGPKLYVPGL